jgi:hypothetical protein
MKRTTISDKLQEIAAEIEQRGSANLTRLTVLKKWFEVPSHLSSFAIFIADQASRRKTKTAKEAGEIIRKARALLADVDVFAPKLRARQPQACMHLFKLFKTSRGMYRGARCASFVIAIYF